MRPIIVTGAAGKTGAVIAATLARQGRAVLAVTRRDPAPALAGLPGIEWLSADLSEPLTIRHAPGAVIHAAAEARPSGEPVGRYVMDNAVATAALASFAARRGCPFVYLSSLSVCGRITAPVVDENTSRIDPGPYGMTKYLGECALNDLAADLPSLSLRLPGLVGPRADGPWLARLARAALADRELVITNAESQFNNVVHVEDLGGVRGRRRRPVLEGGEGCRPRIGGAVDHSRPRRDAEFDCSSRVPPFAIKDHPGVPSRSTRAWRNATSATVRHALSTC